MNNEMDVQELKESDLNEFWKFAEVNALDGAHRIGEWRLDEIATLYGLIVKARTLADHAAEIERLSKERDDLVSLIKASPNLDRKWGEEDLYACVNICLNALFWRKEEVERLSKQLEDAKNRHVQFMVQGGPVVMATDFDAMKARAEAAESKLSQLQLSLREAVNGYEPLREFVGKIADEYDSEEPFHQLYIAARDMSAHIMGVKIGIEQSLGGDPMAGPIKLTAILNGGQQ